MTARSVIALLAFAGLDFAGDFSCSWIGTKEKVDLDIPRPPDAVIGAKNLRVQWEPASSPLPRADQLGQLIQQALGKEFGFSASNPEATLKLSLLSYEPVQTRTYTRRVTERVKVGERTVYGRNGEPRKENVYQDRPVSVTYWEARGSIRISVAVDDSQGVIDSFIASAQQHLERVIEVNGESKLKEGSLPSEDSLETEMLDQISHQIRRRYTATFDRVEALLACDNELKPGNKLAKLGEYAQALEAWKAATMKKNPGDRLFNMAVAKEALAYAEYARSNSLDDMEPLFKEAMDLYEQALRMDPQEKYMQQQVPRLNLAKTNIENLRKQYEVQQEMARRAAEVARKVREQKMAEERRKQELEAACKDTGPDSTEEAKFRPIARTRLSALPGDITEQQFQNEVTFGQRTFGLTELKSFRVVCQEVSRRKELAQKLKDYEDVFAAMVADGRLTQTERSQAKSLQMALGLEDSEIQGVESKLKFKEDGQLAAPKALAPPPKSKAVATKSADPSASPVPSMPAKPRPAKPVIGITPKPKN